MTAYEATRIGVLLANTGTPKSPDRATCAGIWAGF